MEYLFLIYGDRDRIASATPEQRADAMRIHWANYDDAVAEGVFRSWGPLEPTEKAVTVRQTKEGVAWVDGPFAESKEFLGGFYLLDCPDEAAARSWAERISAAALGWVEMRGVAQLPARTTAGNA